MARRNVHFYLIKAARLAGWLLAGLMLIYIYTGYALCGKFGLSDYMDVQTALVIHRIFDWPLVIAFLVHTSISIYFAFRRWGWIKSRTCP